MKKVGGVAIFMYVSRKLSFISSSAQNKFLNILICIKVIKHVRNKRIPCYAVKKLQTSNCAVQGVLIGSNQEIDKCSTLIINPSSLREPSTFSNLNCGFKLVGKCSIII